MADAQSIADALAEPVVLTVGGTRYDGWLSVDVTRSLDALAGQFQLAVSFREATDAPDIAVAAGDRCTLAIGGETVIDGWIDACSPMVDSEQASITIDGRDRTGDLADCSAIHDKRSWRNVKLEAIAAELVQPFGLTVTARADTGKPIKRFALQPAETVQAALERLLRFRGLLMQADAGGNLQIITPTEDAPVATLELGVNIKAITATFDNRERFSEYRVRGQAAGDDDAHGKTVSQISATATDPGVKRFRPLIVIAEDHSDGASAKTRAQWEAGVRRGKSKSAAIDVPGWRVAPGGQLWRPNLRVRVKAARVRLADEIMLVSAVHLSKSEGGTIASLTVMPPEAWKQLAEPEHAQ